MFPLIVGVTYMPAVRESWGTCRRSPLQLESSLALLLCPDGSVVTPFNSTGVAVRESLIYGHFHVLQVESQLSELTVH